MIARIIRLLFDPKPPEGVRLVLDDGSEWPVELRYGGWSPRLGHRWVATTFMSDVDPYEIAGVVLASMPKRGTIEVEGSLPDVAEGRNND